MTQPLAHTAATEHTASEDRYLTMKLLPKRTGLPRAVWITERDSAQHDVRIKVSLIRGGKGRWDDAVPITIRPQPEDITDALPTADFRLICQWIELNRSTITDYWNDQIDPFEVVERLRKLGS
jgi:hypothetical protein